MAKFSCIPVILLIMFTESGQGHIPKDSLWITRQKQILDRNLHSDVSAPKISRESSKQLFVIVVTTWDFGNATVAAYESLTKKNGSAIDAVVEGCSYCEREQCDYTVGFGGSPDERGETTLDAMIYDGDTMDVGAVGGLRRIKNAIAVARAVLEHTILVGDAATEFAKKMGFKEVSLSTNRSFNQWIEWKNNNCEPNFWKKDTPDAETSCASGYSSYNCVKNDNCILRKAYSNGTKKTISKPYERKCLRENRGANNYNTSNNSSKIKGTTSVNEFHHDTIGQIVMDTTGAIVTGSSSNGAIHKIPGRMGDAAVPAAGGYADSRYGAAVATGDGDVMMRFAPAAAVVQRMKDHMSPQKATRQLINMIKEKCPDFKGTILAMDKAGNFGASCHGLEVFPFTVTSSDVDNGRLRKFYVQCFVSGNMNK